MHLIAHLRPVENYFAQYRLGTFDPEDWRAMRAVMISLFQFEPYQQAYSVYKERGAWKPEFEAEVDRILSENKRKAT